MDISQVSFKISGSAGNASKSLSTLITRLEQLDTAFTKAVGSGNATITMLNGITGALGASASQSVASSEAINRLSASITSLSNASKSVKLPTAQLSQHTAITKSATLATKQQNTETKKLNKSLLKMGTNSNHAMGRLGRLVRTLSQLAFVTILTRQVFTGMVAGFKSAINYTENLNLFMVALGENTTRATGFIKEMSESFYLDEASLTRTMGLFYQISESLGLTSEKAYTLSENFTKLAYDLASFYNIKVDEAVTKLQAGLVGETEPLRRIGIIITENNLAETARNLGIRKSIRNMTEQEKIQLRYVTAIQQTQNAQKDLARTMMQPENLLRIFNEQWQVLIRNLGSSFIPMLQKVMPHIIAITKVLADMLGEFAKMRGYVAPMVRDDLGGYSNEVADNAEKQAKSTSKTAKELAKILKYTRDISSATTGIDELNILGEQGGTAFDIGNLFETEDSPKASIDIELPDYDSAMEKAKGAFNDLVEEYDKKIRGLWSNFKETFATSSKAFDDLKESIKGISFSDMDISVWDILNGLVTGVLKGIKDIIEFGKSLYRDVFKPIMDLVAPKWMESLEDGSFAEAIEKIFVLFVTYKVLATVTEISTKLAPIVEHIGPLSTIAAGVKITFDIIDASVKGDWEKLEDKILDAVVFGLAGIAVGIATGSPTAGMLVFSIPVLLDLSVKEIQLTIKHKVEGILEKLFGPTVKDAIARQNAELGIDTNYTVIPTAFDQFPPTTNPFASASTSVPTPTPTPTPSTMSDTDRKVALMQMIVWDEAQPSFWRSHIFTNGFAKIEEYIKDTNNAMKILDAIGADDLTSRNIWDAYIRVTGDESIKPIHANGFAKMGEHFASGGVPEKGNLFIAGEKGPELVTEHNGQTVVMNEKQLAERGVSFFADGVNVPEETENESGKATNGATKIAEDIYKKFKNSVFEKATDGAIKIIDDLYKKFKDSVFGKAIDGATKITKDIYKKFKDSTFGAIDGVTKITEDISKKFKDSAFGKAIDGAIKKTKDIYKKFKDSAFGKAFTATVEGLGKATTALYGVYKTDPVTFSERSSAGGPTEDQKSMALGAMAQIPYLGQVIGVLDAIKSGAVLDFFTNLPNFIEAGMSGFQDLLDGVVEALPAILEQIPVIITKIAEMFSNKDTINKMIQSAIRIVAAIVSALPTIIQALVTAIPNIITTLVSAVIENIPMFLKLGIVVGLAIIDGLVNIITGGINWLIDQLNKIPFVNIGHIPPLNLSGEFAKSAFAEGGFPMQGQMFIAREAGAELVGNIGGRTAVMNNDQIVESVSRGVYEAMISAQRSDRGYVVVNLDGRKISNNQKRVSRTMGLDFGLGGF